MTSVEDGARSRLEAQRDHLARRVERLQAAQREDTVRSGDVGGDTDNAHEWENAEILQGELVEALEELRQTEAALARLSRGEYGVCTVCGSTIEPERLELIPEAVRCAKHA